MAREHAVVKVTIWQDDDWRELPANPKLLYFTLLTAPNLSYCGVTDWRPKRLAAAFPDWSALTIIEAAKVLIERSYIVVDEETEEVLVRSFVRNDGLMKQPRMAVSMTSAYSATASRKIRGVVVHELNRLYNDQPELQGWGKEQARALLKREAVDPAGLAVVSPTFGAEFGGGFTPGLAQTEVEFGGSLLLTPTPSPTPSSKLLTPSQFDEFWAAYPKKVGKEAARKAYIKIPKSVDLDEVTAGARRYATDPNLPEKQFIPDPGTWINAGRWTDEPCPPKPQQHATPTRSTTDDRVNAVLAYRSGNSQQRLEIA
jgi:hypothetical protein